MAASIVHDLRTPLSVLAGEVDLTLRRERTPAEYRAALGRIARQARDLVECTDDLAFLGDPVEWATVAGSAADLAPVVAALDARFAEAACLRLVMAADLAGARIVGDERRLVRALALIVAHGATRRLMDAPMRLRLSRWASGPEPEMVRFELDVPASGFTPSAWDHLIAGRVRIADVGSAGLFGLRTAASIIRASGGSVTVSSDDDADAVDVRLRRA